MKNKKLINAVIVVAFILGTVATGCSNKSIAGIEKSNTNEETKLVEGDKEMTNPQPLEKKTETASKDEVNVTKKTNSISNNYVTKKTNSTNKTDVAKKTNKNEDAVENERLIFGTIKSVDKSSGVIGFDDLELITADKKERMKKIGITDKDFSNFYLYNASNKIRYYKITDKTSITIYSKNNGNKMSTDIKGLYNQFVSGYENHYNIKVKGKYITSISQKILGE
ncbi:hypothetical protein [Clostridium brassicae]|uniref:Lipoprotein n=1 Tax=Clostridium brassicae TaxID=2999072 RepID=A0ABT4D8C9_9CLOT|nr:hypothetical protein [Clostridium brassicae]MCY6958554.1 hypothetical protein [Clostridium brassicae]